MAKIILTPLPKADPGKKSEKKEILVSRISEVDKDKYQKVSISEFLLSNAEREDCKLYCIIEMPRSKGHKCQRGLDIDIIWIKPCCQ